MTLTQMRIRITTIITMMTILTMVIRNHYTIAFNPLILSGQKQHDNGDEMLQAIPKFEMLFIPLPTTLLQIFCNIIHNS